MEKTKTMLGIAKDLGLSRTTVSLCLAGKAPDYRINPETIQRVKKYADEVGFVPNMIARNLVMRQHGSDKVALLMNQASGSEKSMAALRLAMETLKAAGRDYLLQECLTERLVENLRLIKGEGIREVILFGPFLGIGDLSDDLDLLSILFRDMNLYIVDDCFSDRGLPLDHIYRLGVDRWEMCVDLFDRVRESAGNSFAYVQTYVFQEEFETYCTKHQLSFDPTRCLVVDRRIGNLFDIGAALVDQVCELIGRLSIQFLFLFDDRVATGVINGLLSRGVRVPDDLSVIGFDNIDACPHFRVPLTSISVPIERHTERVLSKILDGGTLPPVTKSKSSIIWRDSSMRF